jgi:copper chaperone CopZ
MCKDRIENGMAFEKGVKDVNLDVETKIATIKYNTKSTSPDELRKKISKLGYDADEIPCDKVAYDKLPACCKKDAPKH